jgi:hypothetical protein
MGNREQVRTAAVMRSTVEQLRLAAGILYSSAAVSPSAATQARLRVLGAAVAAPADDIEHCADRMAHDTRGS